VEETKEKRDGGSHFFLGVAEGVGENGTGDVRLAAVCTRRAGVRGGEPVVLTLFGRRASAHDHTLAFFCFSVVLLTVHVFLLELAKVKLSKSTSSRDRWKSKCKRLRQRSRELKKQVLKLEEQVVIGEADLLERSFTPVESEKGVSPNVDHVSEVREQYQNDVQALIIEQLTTFVPINYAINWEDRYKHPNWQRMRLVVMYRDGFKCRRCGEMHQQLHVHHLRYGDNKYVWEVDLDDLETLCERCPLCRTWP
jgi:hypothetical protein